MLQSPYFFFDVVYLHNGLEEQGDETSWRVSESAFLGVIYHLCFSVQEKNSITRLVVILTCIFPVPNLLDYLINAFDIPSDS